MPTITVIAATGEIQLTASEGDNLYQALIRADIPIDGSCGGHRACGKCRVQIHSGKTPAISDTERKHISESDLACGIRLACAITIQSDMTVAPTATQGAAQIITASAESGALPTDGESGYGVGIDIGTTTVAAFLVDLPTGQTIATQSALNAQRPYGADVIARCGYALASDDGKATMETLIRNQIDDLIDALCREARIESTHIRRVALAGNPTMMHLCAGLDVSGIAVAPYAPAYTDAFSMRADALGLRLPADTPVLFLPVVSGYVGADTVAAVAASGMDQSDNLSLLIDIGTNGEIVLGTRDRLICCAAAAGPAFEGGKISCGTGAITGAIDSVYPDFDSFRQHRPHATQSAPMDLHVPFFTTIGDRPAVGLCGSGLIDLVATLCHMGCIDETGVLSPDGCDTRAYTMRFDDQGRFVLAAKQHGAANDVRLTQKDVREVQLAKSAIAAGIDILALRMGVELSQIDRVYLAGGFGNYINHDSACAIGLLPPVLRDRIVGIGNAAGWGARAASCSQAERDRAQNIANRMEYVELAAAKAFSGAFMENMLFPV